MRLSWAADVPVCPSLTVIASFAFIEMGSFPILNILHPVIPVVFLRFGASVECNKDVALI